MYKNLPKTKLDKMIKEATVDSYGDEEQMMGLFNEIEDKLSIPFKAKVLGEEVEIIDFEQADTYHLNAICQRNDKKYKIDILNLEYEPKNVNGYEWLEAYRKSISTF